MIKYIGSKRQLVPVLGEIATAVGARTAVDLFTGTTRVAQEFKRRHIYVTACDMASYAGTLAECYISTDATTVDLANLKQIISQLAALPGQSGYFTETFCRAARFFQPKNGERIDAIRNHLEDHYRDSPLFPILLTSLMEAADRVDSTAGVQMAYLKKWSTRSNKDLDLRLPELLPGPGKSLVGDAVELITQLPPVDLMYLDPPYNQHRYYANYHIWETLIRWDAPEYYGVACKRLDTRAEHNKSVFNLRRTMPQAFNQILQQAKAEVLVVSYNDEAWISPEAMIEALSSAGYSDVRLFSYDSRRYVGAQIGIHSPQGTKVGEVSHLRNTEYIFVAGPSEQVEAAAVALATTPATATQEQECNQPPPAKVTDGG